jgi:hypothetical protein
LRQIEWQLYEQQQQQRQQQQQQQRQRGAQGVWTVSWDEKVQLYEPTHRELLEWELRSARRLWPDDVHVQTRLIKQHLQRSVAEDWQPSNHPSLDRCIAIPNTLAAADTDAALGREVERVAQEIDEQRQQHFARAIVASKLGWAFTKATVPPEHECTAAAKQYWPAMFVQWLEDLDLAVLYIQLLCARRWWPDDVKLQTVLIQQHLRSNVYTMHQSVRSRSDSLCVAIP